MTDLRKAAEMALEALDYEAEEEPDSIWKAERDALRQALAQPTYEFDCPRCGHCCQQRTWVGFTEGEKKYLKALGYVGIDDIEERLKRMNT